ncbi:hypothetical protein CC79DRAFT_1328572 [Sarocladium strictum]
MPPCLSLSCVTHSNLTRTTTTLIQCPPPSDYCTQEFRHGKILSPASIRTLTTDEFADVGGSELVQTKEPIESSLVDP